MKGWNKQRRPWPSNEPGEISFWLIVSKTVLFWGTWFKHPVASDRFCRWKGIDFLKSSLSSFKQWSIPAYLIKSQFFTVSDITTINALECCRKCISQRWFWFETCFNPTKPILKSFIKVKNAGLVHMSFLELGKDSWDFNYMIWKMFNSVLLPQNESQFQPNLCRLTCWLFRSINLRFFNISTLSGIIMLLDSVEY